MNKLIEGFEEMGGRVLPSPIEEASVDAFETNCMLELEQEYLIGDLDRNPDIDERPPMPLRDYLEKVKPFMMTYLGIPSNEEWEEAIEDTMKNVPLIKEVVDQFSGPERVTSNKQKEELERVAKTTPASAPNSVKRFADHAVLSLQVSIYAGNTPITCLGEVMLWRQHIYVLLQVLCECYNVGPFSHQLDNFRETPLGPGSMCIVINQLVHTSFLFQTNKKHCVCL